MHFSIPDTQEFICDRTGSNFTGYNIHINGCFHCCLRYKQIHCLHEQLKRSLPGHVLPPFPSKKLLPLTNNQLEQRRISLERYLQLVGQDAVFSKSELLRIFLLKAQQESSCTQSHEVTLDVHLMNGYRIAVNCYTVECTSRVLEKATRNIDLPAEFIDYFALYLMQTEKDGGVQLIRKLMDFEAPYITQRHLDGCQIVIRKSYWDPTYDEALMHNSIAMNLLYILTLSDIDRGWIMTTPEIRQQLNALQTKGNKKEYLEISRNLPLYGCIKFNSVIVDYPKPNEVASILIGQKELSIQTVIGDRCQETKFKVTRMRCWRVTTNYNSEEIASNSSGDSGQSSNSCSGSSSSSSSTSSTSSCSSNAPGNGHHTMELSFEYLMAKNTLQWITISSEQAMLISVCLQSIVDELLCQKDDYDFSRITQKQQTIKNSHPMVLSYIRRDGIVCNNKSTHRIAASHSNEMISHSEQNDVPLHTTNRSMFAVRKKIKQKISTTVLFRNGKESVHNEAFEEIGDDDL